GLSENLTHFLGHDTSDDVGRTARGERDDHPYGLVRIGCHGGRGRKGRGDAAREGQYCELLMFRDHALVSTIRRFLLLGGNRTEHVRLSLPPLAQFTPNG